MNYSKQRDFVLKALQDLRNHPTADAVYERVRTDLPNISLATVYRNLNQLAENGMIKRIEGLDGSVRFDHQMHDHYHFICTRCNKVFDVVYDIAPDLVEKAESKIGMTIESYDLSFRGVCEDCKKLN